MNSCTRIAPISDLPCRWCPVDQPASAGPGNRSPSLPGAVVDVNGAVTESPLVRQAEVDAALGQRTLANADDDRHEEQVQVVDQPGRERLGSESRAADGDVTCRARLQLPDRL